MPDTTTTVASGGSTSRESPDYAAVEVPSKPPTEFTYQERRADLLRQIRDLGHPSMINQTEVADRYGASQSQISKDLERIAESVREDVIDRDRRAFTVDSVVRRSIRGLLEDVVVKDIHDTDAERAEFLEEALDLRVIRTSDRPRPYEGDPKSKDTDGDVALLEAIADEYAGIDAPRQQGEAPEAVGNPATITTKGVRSLLEDDPRLDDVVAEWKHRPDRRERPT